MIRRILALLVFSISFAVMGQDLTISPTIVSPINGCELSDAEVVKITVVLVSGNYTGNVNVAYSLNGGAEVIETFFVNWNLAGSTSRHEFTTATADLSGCRIHTFDFRVIVPTDTDPSNDEVQIAVASDCSPDVGVIEGPDSVCVGTNTGNLMLVGNNGAIDSWESSIDHVNWTTETSSTSAQPYSNIAAATYYRANLNSPFGFCPAATTSIDTLGVYPLSVGGMLPPGFDVCDNGNEGVLNLSTYTGKVDHWEYSVDGGTNWTSVANKTDSYNYLNINANTVFRVFVVSGTCAGEYSNEMTLSLIPGSDAGIIDGELLVCNFENGSALEVSGYTGVIQDWISSTDSGATYVSTGSSLESYDFSGLLGYTEYGVIVKEEDCPLDTAFHKITVLPTGISAGEDVTINDGDSTLLEGIGGDKYVWFPTTAVDSPNSEMTWVYPRETITYYLQVSDSACKDTVSVTVTVLPVITTFVVPNLITPNGDGFNDVLYIDKIELFEENEFFVFNNFGEVVYQAQPYLNNWGGTFNDEKLPDGTYYYLMKLNDNSFFNVTDYQGVITIVGND